MPVARSKRGLILARRLVTVLLLSSLVWLNWKVLRMVQLTRSIRAEVSALQAIVSDPTAEGLAAAGVPIAAARRDLLALRAEVEPWLWLAPLLTWLPGYGPDLRHAGPLLDWGSSLAIAADETYNGLLPFIWAAWGEGAHPTRRETVNYLAAAQIRFTQAQQALAGAEAARARFDADRLSPQVRPLVEKIDPLLPRWRSGLALLSETPSLLGADRPRTYLVLVQNEDELRATGGFITAVGTITFDHGEVTHLRFENSTQVDDFSHRYPTPPGPIIQYMGIYQWVLRDSNWSPDFPTSAARAETLYNLTRPGESLDGVIALNQAAVQILLRVLGPLTLPDGETVDADNVIDYVHEAVWANLPAQGPYREWSLHRKDFIQHMAAAMVEKVGRVSWLDLGRATLRALDERHILLWLKGRLAVELAAQGWDGALRPGDGDYLMVVDTNTGYNKTNLVVQRQLRYAVDLTTPEAPTARLAVTHINPATGALPCQHFPRPAQFRDYDYLVQRCYWNYLRVYTPPGTSLLSATPHDVPGEWMLGGAPVPGEVRVEQGENNTQTFGVFMVVPFNSALTTAFEYALAPGAVTAEGDALVYRFHFQKQPGVRSLPFSLRVQLPPGAEVVEAEPEGVWEADAWTLEMNLTRDTDVTLKFRAP